MSINDKQMGKFRLTLILAAMVILLSGFTKGVPAPPVLGEEITRQGVVMRLIHAGTFQMGSPGDETNGYPDEKPRHYVKLTKVFYMSKYQITNAQYALFLNVKGVAETSDCNYSGTDYKGAKCTWGENSDRPMLYSDGQSAFGGDWGIKWDGVKWISTATYENHPVIKVTWYGAMEYARWMGGSLPTEAQWEYACRAGTTTHYSFGSTLTADNAYCWFVDNNTADGEISGTKAVGRKQPNVWSLYDMHGNVWEWCLDQWDGSSNYPTADREINAVENPLITAGILRVLRGGSWSDCGRFCGSACRDGSGPGVASDGIGFRVIYVP